MKQEEHKKSNMNGTKTKRNSFLCTHNMYSKNAKNEFKYQSFLTPNVKEENNERRRIRKKKEITLKCWRSNCRMLQMLKSTKIFDKHTKIEKSMKICSIPTQSSATKEIASLVRTCEFSSKFHCVWSFMKQLL